MLEVYEKGQFGMYKNYANRTSYFFLNCESIIYITEDFQPQRINCDLLAGEVLIILVR